MIIWRKIVNPRPPNWAPYHWYVEYHDDQTDMPFPLGTAYVTELPPHSPLGVSAVVDYILVADEHRRKGVATALVRAIEQRWPDVLLTEAISPEGQALLDSLDRPSPDVPVPPDLKTLCFRAVKACARLRDLHGWDRANRVSIRWAEWATRTRLSR